MVLFSPHLHHGRTRRFTRVVVAVVPVVAFDSGVVVLVAGQRAGGGAGGASGGLLSFLVAVAAVVPVIVIVAEALAAAEVLAQVLVDGRPDHRDVTAERGSRPKTANDESAGQQGGTGVVLVRSSVLVVSAARRQKPPHVMHR